MVNKKSVWAIAAGALFIIIVTTVVDVALHAVDVFPPPDQPINDALAVLATSYRIVIGIAGAWLTALLAPTKPMKHSIVLGFVGVVLSVIGMVVTWNLGLGPRWYPILLVVLALPQSWVGGRIHESITATDG